MLQSPKEAVEISQTEYEPHSGYSITVTIWSDRKWTAYISRTEHGTEHILMDNDIEWDRCPDEDYLHEWIDESLEP